MPSSDLTLASFGDTEDLTDRERLALAFGILRERGWFAPVDWSTSLCCTSHGWEQVVGNFNMTKLQWMDTEYDDEPPTLWWHTHSDSAAFCGSVSEAPLSAEMEAKIESVYASSGEDERVLAAWMEEHQDELDADEKIARMTKYVTLLEGLSLHWSGGMAHMDEAVGVLRSVGLVVSAAEDPNHSIFVHPSQPPILVGMRDDGHVALSFGVRDGDLPTVVLRRDDVLDLITMLDTVLGVEGDGQATG